MKEFALIIVLFLVGSTLMSQNKDSLLFSSSDCKIFINKTFHNVRDSRNHSRVYCIYKKSKDTLEIINAGWDRLSVDCSFSREYQSDEGLEQEYIFKTKQWRQEVLGEHGGSLEYYETYYVWNINRKENTYSQTVQYQYEDDYLAFVTDTSSQTQSSMCTTTGRIEFFKNGQILFNEHHNSRCKHSRYTNHNGITDSTITYRWKDCSCRRPNWSTYIYEFKEGKFRAPENFSEAYANAIFKTDTLTENEFRKFERRFNNQIDTTESLIQRDSLGFKIATKDSLFKFKANKKDYSYFDYYQGYVKIINAHIIQAVSSRNEIGWLEIVDYNTNQIYHLEAGGDFPLEKPYVSKNGKWLIGHTNHIYEGDGFTISIWKITNDPVNKYQEHKTFTLEKGFINQAVWVSKGTFAIEMYTPNSWSETNKPKKMKWLKITER